MAGFSPCCMNTGACGCSVLGAGTCSAGLMTGADRCACD
jgi:hypothetical protein